MSEEDIITTEEEVFEEEVVEETADSEVEEPVQEDEQPAKRKRGRPRKEDTRQDNLGVTRETRVPVGGFRKILDVKLKPEIEKIYRPYWC